MKRFIRSCIIAAVSAALFVLSPLVAYAGEINGISVSESVLEQGDVFTVTLSVPPAENADTASVKVLFDDSVFDVVEWNPVLPGGFANIGSGMFALSAANVSRLIDLGGGLTLIAKMRVRDTAPDGYYDLSLADSSFCYVKDNGYEFEEVWFPEVTAVSVAVGADADSMVDVENITDTIEAGERTVSVNTAGNSASGAHSDGLHPLVIVIIVISIILVAIVVAVLIINAMNRR